MSLKASSQVLQSEDDYSDIDASDSLESSSGDVAPQEFALSSETRQDQISEDILSKEEFEKVGS